MKPGPIPYLVILIIAAFLVACREDYSPKPRGYYRIDLPLKQYQPLSGNFPYDFDYPVYALINPYQGKWKDTDTSGYWINVEFPQFGSRLHLTYKRVEKNLKSLIEDAHAYAYKHSVMADAIVQTEFTGSQARVYSVLFDIKGNTASSIQFYATDSVRNFVRGALYFDCEPNKDSLAPVRDFLRSDLIRMIETLTWKKIESK